MRTAVVCALFWLLWGESSSAGSRTRAVKPASENTYTGTLLRPTADRHRLHGTRANATTIHASTFGYDPVDATSAFQAAITSDYDIIVVDLQATDWNVRPSAFWDLTDKTIIFEPGVVLRAIPGAFDATGAKLIRLTHCTNITIIGYGASFVMNKAEYALLNDSEYRHSLAILSCDGITVKGLTLRESGGDGLYVGAEDIGAYSEHILIEDVRAIDHYRQGFSITSAQDVIVRHSLFTGTSGTAPEAGLDIEPNEPTDRAANILFERCSFTNNNHSGIQLSMGEMDAASFPLCITFNDCYMSANGQADGPNEIAMSTNGDDPVRGTITFNRCHVDNSDWTAVFARKPITGYTATFNDCAFTNVSKRQVPYNTPLWVEVTEYSYPCPPFGGVAFNNCLLTYPTTFPYLHCNGWDTTPGVQDVSFSGTVVAPLGQGLVISECADTINCVFNADLVSAMPASTVNHELLQAPATECGATPIIFGATRGGVNLSYPLPFRYGTSGTVHYGDDVHLLTGSLMIPAQAGCAADTVPARWDELAEPVEEMVITPLSTEWYNLTSLTPTAPQVFDCLVAVVGEEQEGTIRVWPNPSPGVFNLAVLAPGVAGDVEVFNVLGQRITTLPIEKGRARIDLSAEPAGTYLLRYVAGGKPARHLLVIR